MAGERYVDLLPSHEAPRLAARTLNNAPGKAVHEAVRGQVLVVQNHGYDVAAIVNINYLHWLESLAEKALAVDAPQGPDA